MATLIRPRGKRDPTYWAIQYSVSGKRAYVTLGRMSREEAEQHLREFEAKQTLGIDPVPDKPGTGVTLDWTLQVVYRPIMERKSVRTQEVEARAIGHLRRHWPGITLDQITIARIETYKTARLKEKCRSRTINMELALLRRVLNAAEDHGYMPDGVPKITMLKMNDSRPSVFLNLEQAKKLQDQLVANAKRGGHGYPSMVAALMALHTGMRSGEVLTRELQDIDWNRGDFGVVEIGPKPHIEWRVKTGNPRIVPLTEILAEQLRNFLEWRGDDPGWLFRTGRQGVLYRIAEGAWELCVDNPMTTQDLAAELEHLRHLGYPDKPWSYSITRAIQKNRKMFRDFGFGKWIGQSRNPYKQSRRLNSFRNALRNACKEAGVPILNPHALRHTWATLAFAAGMDLRVVQELGGWKNPDVPLSIYAHITSDRVLESVRQFPLGRCREAGVLYFPTRRASGHP